jgi:hypothetical protein
MGLRFYGSPWTLPICGKAPGDWAFQVRVCAVVGCDAVFRTAWWNCHEREGANVVFETASSFSLNRMVCPLLVWFAPC